MRECAYSKMVGVYWNLVIGCKTQKEVGELLVGNNVTPIIILYFVFD